MPTYLVFGRTRFEAPLAQRGSIDAADPSAAPGVARERFGDAWVELTLVPSDDVRWIVGPDPPGDGDGEGS